MSTIDLPRNRANLYNRSYQAIILLALFLFASSVRLLPGPRTIDDSFITFRYARNILAGNGFVYNPGEHVLGTTTPLYTFLLTGIGLLTGGTSAPFPTNALVVNAISDGVTCVLLYLIGRRLNAPIPGLGAALVWAIAPFSVTFAIGGLETSIFVLLTVSIVYSYITGRYSWAAFFSALALLTRPDALLLLLPEAADRFWTIISRKPSTKELNVTADTPSLPMQQRKIPVGELLAFILPVGIWIIFSGVYFGSPLPHSIAAKSLVYRLPPDAAFVRLLQHYATPFLEHLTFGTVWIAVGLVLVPFLFLVGAFRILRVTTRAWPFLVYPWLYFIAFSIANPLIFRWYLTPPLPPLILTVLIGMDSLLKTFKSYVPRHTAESNSGTLRAIFATFTALTVVVLPVLLSLHGWVIRPDHGLTRPAPEMAWYQLEILYRQAAAKLNQEIAGHEQETTVAAGDVGVLGFFTGARILDTVGLNSPQSLRYYPLDQSYYEINYAIPPDLILDNHPDYVVILEVYGRRGLLKDPRFQGNYRLIEKIPTDIYGSDGMLIFKQVDK
jgi:arabinofuranosyltransferase